MQRLELVLDLRLGAARYLAPDPEAIFDTRDCAAPPARAMPMFFRVSALPAVVKVDGIAAAGSAGTQNITGIARAGGAAQSRLSKMASGSGARYRATPSPRSRTSSRRCTRNSTRASSRQLPTRWPTPSPTGWSTACMAARPRRCRPTGGNSSAAATDRRHPGARPHRGRRPDRSHQDRRDPLQPHRDDRASGADPVDPPRRSERSRAPQRCRLDPGAQGRH